MNCLVKKKLGIAVSSQNKNIPKNYKHIYKFPKVLHSWSLVCTYCMTCRNMSTCSSRVVFDGCGYVDGSTSNTWVKVSARLQECRKLEWGHYIVYGVIRNNFFLFHDTSILATHSCSLDHLAREYKIYL